jgi:hypothetical protein
MGEASVSPQNSIERSGSGDIPFFFSAPSTAMSSDQPRKEEGNVP